MTLDSNSLLYRFLMSRNLWVLNAVAAIWGFAVGAIVVKTLPCMALVCAFLAIINVGFAFYLFLRSRA